MKTLLLITLCFLFNFIPSFSQNSKIEGVVTYFFNKYQGDKPDIGAKVYLVDSIQNPDFDFNLYKKFLKAKSNRSMFISYSNLYSSYQELAAKYEGKKRYVNEYNDYIKKRDEDKEEAEKYYKEIINDGVETDEKFGTFDNLTFSSYYPAIHKDNIIVKTIGANGDYSIPVNHGTYYVFIVSGNRTGLTRSEILGKIYCSKVVVKENEIKDVSHNFELD